LYDGPLSSAAPCIVLSIGSHRLANNVLLAPMAGLTDVVFRDLVLRLGGGYAVGEMMGSAEGLWDSDKSRLRRAWGASNAPRALQIAGSEPAEMAASARRLVEAGADIVDLNFGCPMKKVCSKAAGSALMREPDRVARITEAVVRAVPVPVTVKMRTGWAPDARNAPELAQLVERAGAQAIVVHGRTRACRFLGRAEHETVARVKQAVAVPVFANGDIDSAAEARRVLAATGVDGVMIGRAAIGAPWLPGVIAGRDEPGWRERWEIVFTHLEGLYGLYGALAGARIARKHVQAYLEGLGFTGTEWSTFCRLGDPGEQQRFLSALAT
jgi:tRNA-dihydrouridine synthase B